MPEREFQRPGCSACEATAVGQWQRRPTKAELAAERNRVTAWREQAIADSRVSETHDFGPLPEAADVTIAVFGCINHLINADLAGHVHGRDCAAPDPDRLPNCDCTPEPTPERDPPTQTVTLPTGWTIPATAIQEAS